MVKNSEELNIIITNYGKQLETLFDGVEIRLFGSYLNNCAKPYSDIDLAVISPDFNGIDYITALKLLNRLKNNICVDIEAIPIAYDDFIAPKLGSIAYEVSKNSKLVYKATF